MRHVVEPVWAIMQIVNIDDPNDPRVAPYQDIRERDLVGRQGRFIAEGKVVLDVLLSTARFPVESILVLENRLTGLDAVIAKAPPGLPIYVASRSVMDSIAGFPMHRGILAVGRRRELQGAEHLLDTLPECALIVVLVGISNHDNLGSIFRNAAAFGADAVFLDTTCCDPLYRKAIRVSVGAALKVPFASFPDPVHLMAELVAKGFDCLALSPNGDSEMRDVRPSKRSALFFGTEGEGLPPPLLARMQTLRIGMVRDFDSLNVAAASAVALHHFSAGRF